MTSDFLFCPTCGDAIPTVAPASSGSGGVDWGLWGQRLGKLFSFRLQMSCFFAAFLVGFVLSLVWKPLIWVGWPLYVLLVLGSVFNDDNVLYCPFCKKRVKMGARACHHCGRTVVPRKT